MDERPTPIAAALVQEFVAVAHGDLTRVEVLLAQEPRLLNAAWDWGGGDWETALGAAAHTGQVEIATLLIERGARVDIFAAAMLGALAVVEAMLDAYPSLIAAPGPHGIPLIAHAAVGGERAAAVHQYLQARLQPA